MRPSVTREGLCKGGFPKQEGILNAGESKYDKILLISVCPSPTSVLRFRQCNAQMFQRGRGGATALTWQHQARLRRSYSTWLFRPRTQSHPFNMSQITQLLCPKLFSKAFALVVFSAQVFFCQTPAILIYLFMCFYTFSLFSVSFWSECFTKAGIIFACFV